MIENAPSSLIILRKRGEITWTPQKASGCMRVELRTNSGVESVANRRRFVDSSRPAFASGQLTISRSS
jgi:hypothetical protein